VATILYRTGTFHGGDGPDRQSLRKQPKIHASVLSNFELRVPHLAIPSVESCTGSARHGDFWQLKPLNGSLSQWHTTPNSNLDEALVRSKFLAKRSEFCCDRGM
jgi:hypothetical protein